MGKVSVESVDLSNLSLTSPKKSAKPPAPDTNPGLCRQAWKAGPDPGGPGELTGFRVSGRGRRGGLL